MNFKKYSKVYMLFFYFVLGAFYNHPAFAMQAGDPVPVQTQNSIVKVGQIAPALILPKEEEQNGNFDFKSGKPTVIISIHSNEYVSKLQEFQKFYEVYKNKVQFFIVTSGVRLETESFYKKNNVMIPIIIDSAIHFIRKYNNSVPSMMITNGDGQVVYNSLIDVEMNSFAQFMGKVIAGDASLPAMSFEPVIRQKGKSPQSIKIGETLAKEKFKDLAGNDFEIKYYGKPTVIFFWLDISLPETLARDMAIIEESYQKNKSKVNYYTVVGAKKKEFVLKTLGEDKCTVPTLFDTGVALNYTFVFPSVVLVDAQGVFCFRPRAFDAANLQQIINETFRPYKALPEPKNAKEWAERGAFFLKEQNYQEAIDAYNKCLILDAEFYSAIIGRGDAHKSLRDSENAYDDYTAAIKFKPEELSNYYKRAEMACDLRRFPQMLADYNNIIESDPKAIKAYLCRGNYYLNNRQNELALADFTKAIESNPQEPEAFIKRGDSYLSMNKYAEAIADYDKAASLNPSDTRIFIGRGRAYLITGQVSKAITEFSNSIAVKSEPNSYYLRGIAHYRQGRLDLTLADFTRCIELDPHEAYGYYQRGIIHHLRQEEVEAAKDFSAASKVSPRNGVILFALAQSLEKNQEQDKALEAYQLALEYLHEDETEKMAKAKSRVEADWDSYPEWIQ